MKISFDNIFRILFWLVLLIGGLILSNYLDKLYFNDFRQNTLFHIITLIPGYFLLRLVIKASRNTGRYLAKYGRVGDLPRLQTNQLVTTGIYACMRHPMHLGLLFMPLAIALIAGSPSFILIIAPLEMLVMLILIKLVEEPQARKKFGQIYIDYEKKVPFFSLKKACLKQLMSSNDS